MNQMLCLLHVIIEPSIVKPYEFSYSSPVKINCFPIVYNRLSVIKGLGLGRCVLVIGLPKIERDPIKVPPS